MRFTFPPLALAAAIALAGCTSLPRERGVSETGELVEQRLGVAPGDPFAGDSPAPIPTEPLDAGQAVRLAFAYNPRIRQEYARLGLGRAELEEARRIANPSFEIERLRPEHGGGSEIARSLTVGVADLLLLPARSRFAAGELERIQQSVAAELLVLATGVEQAWIEAVSAAQIATMRDVVAQAAERSAELAQRFFEAGNIHRLQLEQERAAASQARIAAVRSRVDALRARSELAAMIGLPSDGEWATGDRLPSPPSSLPSLDTLLPLAMEQRLDLAAARRALNLQADTLGLARRWRWIGSVELGYHRESEGDEVKRGPSLSLELPIFSQGQAAIGRAEAELQQAQAEVDTLALAVANETRLAVEQLALVQDIAERYRSALLPQREAVVARSQERVNYMLMGVFELIVARQEEYDAYQEYLEAVRDVWLARADLRRVVGGRLPDDDSVDTGDTIGVDPMLPAAEAPEMDHSMHGAMDHSKHGEMDHSKSREMDHSKHAEMNHSGHGEKDTSKHDGMDHSPQQPHDEHADEAPAEHDHGDHR